MIPAISGALAGTAKKLSTFAGPDRNVFAAPIREARSETTVSADTKGMAGCEKLEGSNAPCEAWSALIQSAV